MRWTVAVVLLTSAVIFAVYKFALPLNTCNTGQLMLMMAPGDHCVLDAQSGKCGGHDNDFSDAHHKRECVSKSDFVALWNAGLCHYDDKTPIINRQGYVMCKPNPVREETVGEWFLHTDTKRAQETGDWRLIQVNGHEILSSYVGMIILGMRDRSSGGYEPRNKQVFDYLASLPGMDRAAFAKHISWLEEHPGAFTEAAYCKDLPENCKT